MKANKLLTILILLLAISFLIAGCDDKEFDEEAPFGREVM
jgi:uncharacterized lipoprotein YehR (DUF1307 family)